MTDEATQLRESVRAAFTDLSAPSEVRRRMATARGWDDKLWRRLCGELELSGLAVPEEYGGSGFSAVELGIVFEEAGRCLLCAPLFSGAGLAAPLLLALDDVAARERYLPGICDGSTVATVVTSDTFGTSVLDRPSVEAVERDGTAVLSGEAGYVIDGAFADLILVPARTPEGLRVYAVDATAQGLRAIPLSTLDQTRKQARLIFDRVPASGRIGGSEAATAVRRAFDVARALLAGEQAGAAGRCLEITVEYAKTRVQFGRPIGSFQAVKQKAAEMLILVESARSAAMTAAASAAGLPDAPALAQAAAIAHAYCSEAFVAVAAEMIQLHGGIGFTWEHDAHLYFKRAWTSRELLGHPEEQLEVLARSLSFDGRGVAGG
jgi:acyl-CoA dehydrogenase